MGGVASAIGLARDLRRLLRFRRPFVTTLYKGLYPSYRVAQQHLPPGHLTGFDHQAAVDYHEAHESSWAYSDYPPAFWLARALPSVTRVFDLGGGWGQSFYGFRDRCGFPDALSWTVFDLPAFIERGRAIASDRGERQLHFTQDLARAGEADLLFTDGALQYLEDDLPTLLSRLDHKPGHLLINRLPLDAGDGFFTVQRSQHSFCVYHVAGRARFLQGLEAQGYVLQDGWEMPRSLDVVFHPERTVHTYSGFYAVRQEPQPAHPTPGALLPANESS